MLLCAVLSDTVLLNSPTTTERDRTVIEYLEQMLDLDAIAFGREMFEATSDVSGPVRRRDRLAATRRSTSCRRRDDLDRADRDGRQAGPRAAARSCARRSQEVRERNGYALAALMVTDILERGTYLLASGDVAAVERAFGARTATATASSTCPA